MLMAGAIVVKGQTILLINRLDQGEITLPQIRRCNLDSTFGIFRCRIWRLAKYIREKQVVGIRRPSKGKGKREGASLPLLAWQSKSILVLEFTKRICYSVFAKLNKKHRSKTFQNSSPF